MTSIIKGAFQKDDPIALVNDYMDARWFKETEHAEALDVANTFGGIVMTLRTSLELDGVEN